MKKITLLFAIAITFCTAHSQIVLDHEYTNTDWWGFGIILLDNNVSEYISQSEDNLTVNFYNLDNSLSNTIVIDTAGLGLPSNASLKTIFINYTTNKLFDNDDGIEIPVSFGWWDNVNYTDNYVFFVFDDDGSVILSVTNCSVRIDGKPDGFISNTSVGTKMFLNQGDNTLVYSLPGSLPCGICPDVTNGKNDIQQLNTSNLSNPYPNPTSDYTRIDYQLPDHENSGEITVYDMSGIEVKKYKVDKTFNYLKISTRDLSAGTYFYNLKTQSGISTGKKIIVVK